MNRIFFKTLIIGLLSMVFLLSGCKKEESESNYFSVTDSYSNISQTFGLKYCSIMKDGLTDKGTYMYYIMLSSSSIYVSDLDMPESKGKNVYIRLYSEDETLPTGQYTYDPYSTKDKFTVGFCDSDFYPGYAVFYSGVINIVHNGNKVTIDFEFYNTETNPDFYMKLDGYYSGTVKELLKPTE